MKNIKNKLLFVLTSAILAAGLTVSASAQTCSGGGGGWNTILSNAGGSNCFSDSGSFGCLYGSDCSNALSSSDLKSLLGDLYSYCPSKPACDGARESAGSQSDAAGTNQTCQNSANQETADKPCSANDQAATGQSSCPTAASEQTDSSTAAAAETSSPSEKAVTKTETVAQTAVTKTPAKPEAAPKPQTAAKPETAAKTVTEPAPAAQGTSAPVTASAPTSSTCNTAGKQTPDCNTTPSSGNTLMQCIDNFLKKCGIDLNSLGITLPGCGNDGTNETAQQPNTDGNTGTTTPTGSNSDTSNPDTSSGSGSTQDSAPSNQSGSGSDVDNLSYEKQVVALVNEQRAANGLQPLTLSTALSNAARTKSQDMHDHHYFAHESPTYGSPFEMLTSFGISYRTAGENIAMGYATPEAVMNAWMNSSGHRANILNASYTQIGIGYVASGNYWTQEFIG